MLVTKNIFKHFADQTALSDVSIEVPTGSIFGLLGPNGAGKTTLIRIINQITGPDRGEVLLDGEKLQPKHTAQIGYLPEERGLYKKMKVGEQCMYLAQLKGMSKDVAKAELRKWFFKFGVENWWNKKVEDLSKGMAQKIQFISTVLHRPKLLILDEPFSGFDPINAQLIKNEILQLRGEGATIILSTHNMGSVEEICEHIALIHQSKKMLDGKVSAIKSKFKSNVYQIDFTGNLIAFTNALWTQFELIEKEVKGEVTSAQIRLLGGSTVNQLLEAVLPHAKIHGIKEVVPSMNDIFIQVVENKKSEDE